LSALPGVAKDAQMGASEPLIRALAWRLIMANTLAAVLVMAYFTMLVRLPEGRSWAAHVGAVTASFAMLDVLFCVVGVRVARTRFKPLVSWLDEERPPTDHEREAILSLPFRLALLVSWFWIVAVVIAFVVTALVPNSSVTVALANALSTMQGGLVACAATFLLTEELGRPTVARVLAQSADLPPRRRTVGVRARLLLVWVLGSGIPFLAIMLTPVVATQEHELPLEVPMVFLAIVGFGAGLALATQTARWIADPVDEVRGALTQVGEGNLDVTVVVNDGGEIGQLQRGVNDMVEGLRERERLADLFGRHVGAEVAQRAREHGAELGGVLRTVTAFFVDIIGSTTLARERSAGEVVVILNDFFAAVVRCVETEGGWVNKFEGDAALCVFGAPTEQPDHQARALRSARALRVELDNLATVHRGVDAGIGISSGPAVAGNIGALSRLEYTIIGQPVNEAARLSDAAKVRPGKVLAAASTVEDAGAEARSWGSCGSVDLRGLPSGFAVCEPRS
jgi:adenylate cyclase